MLFIVGYSYDSELKHTKLFEVVINEPVWQDIKI
jgi:hypothetical protein